MSTNDKNTFSFSQMSEDELRDVLLDDCDLSEGVNMFEDETPDIPKMTEEEFAAFTLRYLDEFPPEPCDLLRPIMRGIMGSQIADLMFAAASCGG